MTMPLAPIQEKTFNAAALIGQQRFSQASELLGDLLRTLSENSLHFRSSSKQKERCLQVSDLVIVPVGEQGSTACPDWDGELFHTPFTFFVREGTSATPAVTEQVAIASASVALFNIGLCFQLQALVGDARLQASALRNACSFYNHAWTNLHKFAGGVVARDARTTFLLMALCTNLSKCCYGLAELHAANQWMDALRHLLQVCWIADEDDSLSWDLHNYFLMTSTLNTGFLAAGAA